MSSGPTTMEALRWQVRQKHPEWFDPAAYPERKRGKLGRPSFGNPRRKRRGGRAKQKRLTVDELMALSEKAKR